MTLTLASGTLLGSVKDGRGAEGRAPDCEGASGARPQGGQLWGSCARRLVKKGAVSPDKEGSLRSPSVTLPVHVLTVTSRVDPVYGA